MQSHMTSKVVSKRQIWALPPARSVLESQGMRHVAPLLLCIFHLPAPNAPLEDPRPAPPFRQLPPSPKNSFLGFLRPNGRPWGNDMPLLPREHTQANGEQRLW